MSGALTAMRIVVTAHPGLGVAQDRIGAQPPDERDLLGLSACAAFCSAGAAATASGAGAAVVVGLALCHLTDLRGSCAVGRPRRSWNVSDAAGRSSPDSGVKGLSRRRGANPHERAALPLDSVKGRSAVLRSSHHGHCSATWSNATGGHGLGQMPTPATTPQLRSPGRCAARLQQQARSTNTSRTASTGWQSGRACAAQGCARRRRACTRECPRFTRPRRSRVRASLRRADRGGSPLRGIRQSLRVLAAAELARAYPRRGDSTQRGQRSVGSETRGVWRVARPLARERAAPVRRWQPDPLAARDHADDERTERRKMMSERSDERRQCGRARRWEPTPRQPLRGRPARTATRPQRVRKPQQPEQDQAEDGHA